MKKMTSEGYHRIQAIDCVRIISLNFCYGKIHCERLLPVNPIFEFFYDVVLEQMLLFKATHGE